MPFLADLHLTERQPSRCRLMPDEVAFLVERHAAHIDVRPTMRRHVWRLTPAGVAGVLSTPRRRILIAPKIPLSSIFFLLNPHAALPSGPDHARPASADGLIDALAGLLGQLMLERTAAGLSRGYQEESYQGPLLTGRIDLSAQLRQSPLRRDQLHSRRDDFTADLACNQLPCALARTLVPSPLLGAATRQVLYQALAGFADVTEAALTPELLARLERAAIPEAYRSLCDLCRLLAEGLAPGLPSAATPVPAFLLPLERLFEQYVTRSVEEAFAGTSFVVRAQGTHQTGAPALTFRPDITVERNGRTVLIVDAKWKRLPGASAVVEDFYQALAYAVLLDAPLAVLLYPGRRQLVWDYQVPAGRPCVQVRTLDVGSGPVRCQQRRQQLMQALSAAVAG